MTTAFDLVRQARYLLTEEASWDRLFLATNLKRDPVPVTHARRFSLVGALYRAEADLNADESAVYASRLAIMKHVSHDSLTLFNEDPNTTHAMILAALDGAVNDLLVAS